MFDAKCPYCNEAQEINHDDGYGYAEDVIYQQQCWACERTYTFTTSIIFSYDLEKAPCLNGAEHEFKATFTMPVEYTKMECPTCGLQRAASEDEINAARAYHAEVRSRPPHTERRD